MPVVKGAHQLWRKVGFIFKLVFIDRNTYQLLTYISLTPFVLSPNHDNAKRIIVG